MGAIYGDRMHIRRFVYELSRGEYFVYICDDDYWISPHLLERQMGYFRQYPNAVMVTGGQLSCFLEEGEEAPLIDDQNLHLYVDNDLNALNSRLCFFNHAFPRFFMTSDDFLEYFSSHPIKSNIIGGARLYKKAPFIQSGTLQSLEGAKWQAGYELSLGPACYGDCLYINEPCILTEIRPQNASFNRTQREHYLDCITSVNKAFETPFKDWRDKRRRVFLERIRRRVIKNISSAFMSNALRIKIFGTLGMCTASNMRLSVNTATILKIHARNGVRFSFKDVIKLFLLSLPTAWLIMINRCFHVILKRNIVIPMPNRMMKCA